ncbi:ABC transporter permease [Microbacterium capsulatum]|uniref:ABC transporter permease n=1 Tax=Microbacterium capsulatum TaxID=3041921 RepID=A0ABU0XLB5_9MICO|nr:ABC transporter permease [Microbacterium sp. ASV81]MDQ4214520.1 ABC transporter permease [Microbacterium sp. ASV81]
MSTETTPAAPASEPASSSNGGPESPAAPPTRRIQEIPVSNRVLREILRGSAVTTVLAVLLALIVGGVLIAVTNPDVQTASGYFFARPSDMLGAAWTAVSGAYSALFTGSIIDFGASDFWSAVKPLGNTVGFAVPLIAAGLGIAVAFRVGLFNIGARGQMLIACAAAALVTFQLNLPAIIQVPLTLVVGIAAGALWGGLVGLLKARTGAHEVILTIMLNYIAFYLLTWMVRVPQLLQKPGQIQPITRPTPHSAVLPPLPGLSLIDWGFVIVIVATLFVWWLVERSSLGFRMRAVGENPRAARAAGISVPRVYIYAMLFSGGLAGLAGMFQIQSSITSGFDGGIDAGVGFTAITVALLGRSRAWGTFWAGLLFGALKAGSFPMQALQSIPVDIVLVVQSLIVLFIAAPPLIRTIFFLPKDDSERSPRARARIARRRAAHTEPTDSKAAAA